MPICCLAMIERDVVGVPALFLLYSVFTGLYLGWPRNGNWRSSLTIKWGETQERVTYNVHKALGLHLAAVLIVLLFVGIYLIFTP